MVALFRFAGASGFSAAGMEGALRTARSYPAERFDEILIRELGRSAKKAAEETAEAESKAQMERFRKLNRLTHELAHHGAKNATFCAIYIQSHLFTKTGSGQT